MPGLMDVAGLLLSLLGQGESLAGIFGNNGPSFADLVKKLEQDIEQVFRQDLADEAVKDAAAQAQTSSDWLRIDYRNAVTGGESKERLWDRLNDSSDGPELGKLKDQAGIMEAWARDRPDAIAQQTIALALTIHGLIITIYRERSLQAPTPKVRTDEFQNMRDYARVAAQRVSPLFKSVKTARFDAVKAPVEKIFHFCWVVNDAWPEGSIIDFAAFRPYVPAPVPDNKTQINQFYAAYLQLLRTGSGTDRDALIAALSSPRSAFVGGRVDGERKAPDRKDIIANHVPGVQATGKWLATIAAALQNLRKIAKPLSKRGK